MENIEEQEEVVLEDNKKDDYEPTFFAFANQPREGFEDDDPEGEEEDQEGTEPEGEEPPKMSETTEEDEAYFKLAWGTIDTTRAMIFSWMVSGGVEEAERYKFIKDWNDSQHKETLMAGRLVAKKWKFSSFQHMPEFMLLLGLVVSTGIMWKLAKEDKASRQQEATQAPPTTPAQKPKTKEVKLQPISKKAK